MSVLPREALRSVYSIVPELDRCWYGGHAVPLKKRHNAALFRFGFRVFFLSMLLLLPGVFAPVPFLAQVKPAVAQERLETVLSSVVRLHAEVPGDARTASSLGQVREGNGVVIDDHGLVLTIGYLILEAQSVSLFAADGVEVAAEILAYDHESGFGLVRASRPLGTGHVPLGDSAKLVERDRVLVVGHGGAAGTIGAFVASRREFAGYWEYLLDDAIYTVPPHPNWGGAALVNPAGELVGIGSLIVNDAVQANAASPGNMFVPINVLKPIFADLLDSGRSSGPRRPWLGMLTAEAFGRVVVTGVTPGGPSSQAGMAPGDVLLEVDGEAVSNMASLFRKVWSKGAAGIKVPLKVLRGRDIVSVNVTSGDRYNYLRLKPKFY